MKKSLLVCASALLPFSIFAQSAFDGFTLSKSDDLKGTARFMSMGGSFGALGGDLSTLSQNPGGIGVYRSSELGFTLDLDCQHNTVSSMGASNSTDRTKMLLNNIGGVATFRLGNSGLRNLNIGFTYNKAASFNRRYAGAIPMLETSMSNYIAGVSNNWGVQLDNVKTTNTFDPYLSDVPWISVLGYDSRLISPTGDENNPTWVGQFDNGTQGRGSIITEEKGAIDEYNIALGGNINNIVYWGMDFGIIDLNYTYESRWAENLTNAWVANNNDVLVRSAANWNLYNYFNMNGTGFNYKLGFIVKPIQELRLGFAFHTPTWYSIDQTFYGEVNYQYDNGVPDGYAQTNNGYDGVSSFNFRTPWRFIFSAAGVIGNNLILAANYELSSKQYMHFSDPADNSYDWSYDGQFGDSYYLTNQDVKNYYKTQNTFSLGAEYRVTPQFSLRAGYRFVSSPMKSEVKDNQTEIYTAGTRPMYVADNSTNYVTAGLGYRIKAFYVDLAYVYRHQSATFHAFSPDPADHAVKSPQADLSLNNHQAVLSMGFKF